MIYIYKTVDPELCFISYKELDYVLLKTHEGIFKTQTTLDFKISNHFVLENQPQPWVKTRGVVRIEELDKVLEALDNPKATGSYKSNILQYSTEKNVFHVSDQLQNGFDLFYKLKRRMFNTEFKQAFYENIIEEEIEAPPLLNSTNRIALLSKEDENVYMFQRNNKILYTYIKPNTKHINIKIKGFKEFLGSNLNEADQELFNLFLDQYFK